MGRNNHNARMHMIWHRRYGAYDDLAYYDELAKKKALEEKAKKVEPELANEMNSNQTKQKCNNAPSKYGRESVVDIHHFLYADVVNANIMINAIKNKKDIVEILNKIEDLMKRDVRTNPSPKSQLSYFPKMDNAFRFLSILAEELDCAVSEIMCDDEFMRRKFAYDLLDGLKELETDFICDIDDGYAELTIDNFDFKYGMTPNVYRNIYDRMSLTITKQTYDDGEVFYSLSFGCLLLDDRTKDKYMTKGAYIWEESEGHLKDFVEKIIAWE